MRDYLSQNAGALMAGDANALAGYAQYDPQGAFTMQRQMGADRRAQESHQMGMQLDTAQLDRYRAEGKRAGELHAQKMDDRAKAQAAQEIETAIRPFAVAYSQGPEAFTAFVQQNAQGLQQAGIDPAAVTYDTFPMQASKLKGAAEGLVSGLQIGGALRLDSGMTTGMQTLSQRAAAAGLEPGTPEYQQFMLQGGKAPRGMRIETRPDGSMVFTEGDVTEEAGIQPASTDYMVSTIEGILNDPALEGSTGIWSWTQNIPGTDARRFGARARQLEGQAFLQAFESLKGGGQITEVEGQKATQAIGRLDTAQKPEDYRAALTELLDILKAAQSRPQGWAQQQDGAQGGGMSDDDLLRKYGAE